MWTCSKCGTRVDPAFEVCWRCGTNYQGEEDSDFVVADDASPIADPTDYLRLDVGKPDEGELPAAPSELVPCFESNSPVEAKLVADELAAEGIRSALQNTVGSGQIPAGVFSLYPCLVVVEAGDLDRAGPVVKAFRARWPGR